MSILTAYFDDSGGEKFYVVGGAVASIQQMARLARQWSNTISPWNLSRGYFHTTDFVSGYNDYSGWSKEQKAERLMKLVHIIREHVRFMAGTVVGKADFDEACQKVPNKHIGTGVRFCTTMTMVWVEAWRKKSAKRSPVGFVCEAGNRLMNDYFQDLNRVGEFEYLRDKYGIASLKQFSKKDAPALQCADVIAYALYKSLGQDTMEPYLERCFSQLFEIDHDGKLFNRDEIEERLEKVGWPANREQVAKKTDSPNAKP